MDASESRAFLIDLFDVAVDAALPSEVLAAHLPERPEGRTVVLAAGKGAAAMARAVEEAWDGPLEGLAVTRYGHGVPCERIEVVEAAHPVPDAAGRAAAGRLLDLARGLGPDDLALCLISGGGSALLSLPAPGLTLEDKQAVNRSLLASGASITEMNTVRKHLSAIKGGQLARAAEPARVVTLAISDVPGDDPSVIASGPTVPDPSTFAQVRDIVGHYGIDLPETVRRHLDAAAIETPASFDGDPDYRLIATPMMSLKAAARAARDAGITPLILGDRLEGEAREMGKTLGGMALSVHATGVPAAVPCVLLSGGEATVTLKGTGRGGPNAEFLLGMAVALDGAPDIAAIACDTDGIDGSEDNAGAVIGPDTLTRAREKGLDPRAFLENNDAYGFFQALGDLVVPGPTFTNVNDFRAIFVS